MTNMLHTNTHCHQLLSLYCNTQAGVSDASNANTVSCGTRSFKVTWWHVAVKDRLCKVKRKHAAIKEMQSEHCQMLFWCSVYMLYSLCSCSLHSEFGNCPCVVNRLLLTSLCFYSSQFMARQLLRDSSYSLQAAHRMSRSHKSNT